MKKIFKNFHFNNLNFFLVTTIILLYFFQYTEIISFKFIYLSQLVILLVILKNEIKINKIFIIQILFALLFLFFNNEIKYSSYLITVILFNFLLKTEQINVNFFSKNKLCFYLPILFLIIFACEINSNRTFLSLIFTNFLEYESLGLNSYREASGYLYSSKFEYLRNTKYRYFNIDSNYASILILMMFNILNFNDQKNYVKKFTIFSFILLFFTQSKSGVVFYLINLIFNKFKIKLMKQVLIIFLFNIVFIFAGYIFYKNFQNPYYFTNLNKKNDHSYLIYKKEICTKEFSFLKKFSDCPNQKKISHLTNFFGVSTYLKLYSVGNSFDDIKKNFFIYLFPNPLDKILMNSKESEIKRNNEFSAHNFFIKGVQYFGIFYFILFLFNLFYLFSRTNNFNFFPSIISSTFIGIDIFLFLPLIILSFHKPKKNEH
tara:strand:- start:4183 stop:5475 length:1293 start_codon:yes stop_codon:yes gene_type:complete